MGEMTNDSDKRKVEKMAIVKLTAHCTEIGEAHGSRFFRDFEIRASWVNAFGSRNYGCYEYHRAAWLERGEMSSAHANYLIACSYSDIVVEVYVHCDRCDNIFRERHMPIADDYDCICKGCSEKVLGRSNGA